MCLCVSMYHYVFMCVHVFVYHQDLVIRFFLMGMHHESV